MTRRVPPGASAIVPTGAPQTPKGKSAEDPAPQVSGEIYPLANYSDSQTSETTRGKASRSARPPRRRSRVTNGRVGSEPGRARLRVFVCSFCSTAEVVPWCGQDPNCGHPECGEALERCADSHRVNERRFHGPVNVAIIERRVWERYAGKVAEEAS